MAFETDQRVAKALAAPTRAAILELVKGRGPLTAKEVADDTGVHANVARSHLEMLASAGLVRVTWRRNEAGGRPAKQYEAAPGHVEEGGRLVADMLATLCEFASPAPDLARRVAEESGGKLGRRFRPPAEVVSNDSFMDALMAALASVSGGVRIRERGEDWVEVEDLDCPFKGIAAEHPEIACTLDKALKEGIMRGLGADAFVEQVTSVAWGDPTCREVVRIRGTAGA